MLKLSIVLPIYNVERFISDCLDSLYEQDLTEDEYEIVCVIDGSPDYSQAVIEQYMRKHSNIRLILQENQGVCVARNAGLKNAKGKYVWFVDPDDIIASKCFGKIYAGLEKEQADIFEMQYRTCEESYKFLPEVVDFAIDGQNKKDSSGSGWMYVCRRDYLNENGIVFNEKLSYGEDYLWAFQVKYRKHKSIYTNAALYVYRQRKNSAMHTNNQMKTRKRMDDMLELYSIYGEEAKRCEKADMGKEIMKNISRRQQLCAEATLFCLMRLKLSKVDIEKKLKELQEIGAYPYKFMFWNLFGKGTVNPLKVRILTFLFPIKSYYLLLCSLYRFL